VLLLKYSSRLLIRTLSATEDDNVLMFLFVVKTRRTRVKRWRRSQTWTPLTRRSPFCKPSSPNSPFRSDTSVT